MMSEQEILNGTWLKGTAGFI